MFPMDLAEVSLDPADADSVYDSLPVNQLFDGLVATDPAARRPSIASCTMYSIRNERPNDVDSAPRKDGR